MTVALRLMVTLMLVILSGKWLAVLSTAGRKQTEGDGTKKGNNFRKRRGQISVEINKPEVDGHKGQPDDASCVHGEPNVLGLVESGGNFARDDGVDGAEEDQQDRIGKRLSFTGGK